MNSLTLKPDIKELITINNSIYNVTNKKDVKLDLIIEELFVNIVYYSGTDFIRANFEFDESNSKLNFEFIDNGIKFNPLEQEEPEPISNIENISIGGRGITLIKKCVDNISYNYINDENHLKFTKFLKNVKQD